MAGINRQWHTREDDLPEPGERVLICVGDAFVGEGYIGIREGEKKWFRYCDLDPVEEFMSEKVTAWMKMPKPPKKESK